MSDYKIYDDHGNHIGDAKEVSYGGSFLDLPIPVFLICVGILELIIAIPIGLLGGIGAALGFIFWYSVIIGVAMGIGALIGWILGGISNAINNRK